MMNKISQHFQSPFLDKHQAVYRIDDKKHGLLAFIAIHRLGKDGRAFGATRVNTYKTERDALNDALRLSKLMSYKSAISKLGYGGAKGVIILDKKKNVKKEKLLEIYARYVNDLNGSFITGSDFGVSYNDILLMRSVTPYIVGIKSSPEIFTAKSVVNALEVCLNHQLISNQISIAVQGLGKVGQALLELLKNRCALYVSDINNCILTETSHKYPSIKIVKSNIQELKVDVFMPCAIGDAISRANIEKLKCKIIVGAANIQLEQDNLASILMKRNILYAPDYIANAGGLISVVDEFDNESFNPDRVLAKLDELKIHFRHILEESRRVNIPPYFFSNDIAENYFIAQAK